LNILTFDLEEWFHINDSTWVGVDQWPSLEIRVLENTQKILSFLNKHKIKSTFFVLGWIAEEYPDLIRKIDKEGHDIGYHSYLHRIPKFQNRKDFEIDLIKGLSLLTDIVHKPIKLYRAPNFSLNNKWILDCLISNGIEVSSSIKNPMRYGKIELPKQPYKFKQGVKEIIEFPLNTIYLVYLKFALSGSGYFRITPKWILDKYLKNNKYNILYFHPNDFDINIPKPVKLGYYRNALNSIGTKTTLPKLEYLAKNHDFISINQSLKLLDLSQLPVIKY